MLKVQKWAVVADGPIGSYARCHTSAHQHELISSGLDNFLVIGDVYRRDDVDSTHYPCFHQMEGVRIFSSEELFQTPKPGSGLRLLDPEPLTNPRQPDRQEWHTADAAKLLEVDLKQTLEAMAGTLFGQNAKMRWVDTYFPFTHPSWELEVEFQGKWIETLGCGIIEQKLLQSAGAGSKVGWAFGLGLERLAMRLYQIPDIRLFWSTDHAFLNQFKGLHPDSDYTFKPISAFKPQFHDVSFWLPKSVTTKEGIAAVKSDFCDLIRSEGGDFVEQVDIFDQFFHPKMERNSLAYRICYRHMTQEMSHEQAVDLHLRLGELAGEKLGLELRR